MTTTTTTIESEWDGRLAFTLFLQNKTIADENVDLMDAVDPLESFADLLFFLSFFLSSFFFYFRLFVWRERSVVTNRWAAKSFTSCSTTSWSPITFGCSARDSICTQFWWWPSYLKVPSWNGFIWSAGLYRPSSPPSTPVSEPPFPRKPISEFCLEFNFSNVFFFSRVNSWLIITKINIIAKAMSWMNYFVMIHVSVYLSGRDINVDYDRQHLKERFPFFLVSTWQMKSPTWDSRVMGKTVRAWAEVRQAIEGNMAVVLLSKIDG